MTVRPLKIVYVKPSQENRLRSNTLSRLFQNVQNVQNQEVLRVPNDEFNVAGDIHIFL